MQTPLTFFISEQKQILVATLVGTLERRSTPILEECAQEIAKRDVRWVILNFRDVPKDLDLSLIPLLARIQKQIRARPAELRLAAIHPELKKILFDRGILRQEELCDNLAQALQSLSLQVSKKAG